jgi:hypothetical protein
MLRLYGYKGFTLEVAVQTDFNLVLGNDQGSTGYVVDVTIGRPEGTVATFYETRLGDASGKPYYFSTQGEALMAGYSAGRRIVNTLLTPGL